MDHCDATDLLQLPATVHNDLTKNRVVEDSRADSNVADAGLVSRLRHGDQRALEEFYRQHGPVVRAYVRRFVRRDDAEDVVQQVFFELWRSRHRIDPERSIVGFTLGIARKRSIDYLRRRKDLIIDVNDLRELAGDDGDDLIDRLTWASAVRSGLDDLGVDQREALELAYFGDLTQKEIADRLGVPIGTVKARMARGMRRLAEKIEKGELI